METYLSKGYGIEQGPIEIWVFFIHWLNLSCHKLNYNLKKLYLYQKIVREKFHGLLNNMKNLHNNKCSLKLN